MNEFSFVHTADLHLGYQQYGLVERFRDYGDVFAEVADYAIQKDVDFFLISGDIFDDRNINAMTFSQSYEVLEDLVKNDVKVFAIEGNHDKAYYNEGMSWLEALDYQGLLDLIKINSNDYLDILGDFRELEINGSLIRVFGVKYVGARTKELIPKIKKEINLVNRKRENADFCILMMHFGLDDQTEANLGEGYSYDKLLPLKDVVDYLALGHYHIAYEVKEWVFNPGSLEAMKMDEVGYPSGFWYFENNQSELLEVDSKRPFVNIRIDLENHASPGSVLSNVEKEVEKVDFQDFNKKPVVNLVFEGNLRFKRSELPIKESKKFFSNKSIHTNSKIISEREEIDFDDLDISKKKEIEKEVLKDLVRAQRPDLGGGANKITDALVEVKDMAVEGSNDENIIDRLRSCFSELEHCEEEKKEERKEKEDEKTWDWKEAY
ncbi:hypothetical protein C9439_01350 [archaeon SCG-AAA382B04]|nr:hypothetical protein C9439_01350 [archaeon SCG-AAA382B04]